jgi:pimeloyl-ACP methyl ester carboxylesterase
MRNARLSVLVAVATFTLIAAASSQEVGPLAIAKQGYFFVGGKYVDTAEYGRVTAGQAYVEYQIPQNRTEPLPVIMIAGGGLSGANFTGTPDGRDGWAQYFLSRGYAVYVIDQVGRGRAAHVTPVYGPPRLFNVKYLEEYFIAPERYEHWPQARLHTQWPGSGRAGDPIFDQIMAQRLTDMGDLVQREELNRDATAALLDKIGPAILLTHSQSGAYSWAIADVRPALVKGIVGIEAGGPPFYEVLYPGPPDWFTDGKITKPWGLNYSKVTYAPAPADPSELAIVRQEKPDGPDLVRCWLQKDPARQLPNLKGIPILLLTTEASFHVAYDHCASLYLKQAGVDNDFVRLPDLGIHGNGHYMMFEKNSLRIAGVIADWLQKKVNVAKAQ